MTSSSNLNVQPSAHEYQLESLRDLIEVYDTEIHYLDDRIHRQLRDDVGYRVIQQLNGVGPVHAAAFVAEIGDVSRFPTPKRLCSWAGLTPRLRESDTKTHRGSITKQGSTLVRWSAVEAASRYHGGAPIRDTYRRVAERQRRPGRRGEEAAHAHPYVLRFRGSLHHLRREYGVSYGRYVVGRLSESGQVEV